MSENAASIQPKTPPLFVLDLGKNGGHLAPKKYDELIAWIEREQNFWSRLRKEVSNINLPYLDKLFNSIDSALDSAKNACKSSDGDIVRSLSFLERCKSTIKQIFDFHKLPHSSTSLAKRVEKYREEHGDRAGASFLFFMIVPLEENIHSPVNNVEGWQVILHALHERFPIAQHAAKGKLMVAEQAFELLRDKTEKFLGDETAKYEALCVDYACLVENLREKSEIQENELLELKEKHLVAMEAIRKTFREEIALRAPAEYWNAKKTKHCRAACVLGVLSFAGIAGAACWFWKHIQQMVDRQASGGSVQAAAERGATTPELWSFAVFALVGVFVVWGLRLLVRLFLSHVHLLTDAGERVVMVQTYLSLLEGDKLASHEDRQLILQALFRPASDGIVKDEGVPFSLAEMLTRSGRP